MVHISRSAARAAVPDGMEVRYEETREVRQLAREGSIPGRVVLALGPELLVIMLNQYKYSIKCTYEIASEWYFI